MSKRALWLCAVIVVGAASSAPAAEWRYAPDSEGWIATRRAIQQRHDAIAYLEANPQTDEGYKAPIIRRARREIERLHAALEHPQWRYVTPCCYSRPPIRMR